MELYEAQINEMIFWGATGQAKVLRECMKHSKWKLSALFDNNDNLTSPFIDIPLYYGKRGFKIWIAKKKIKNSVGYLVAIGGDRGNERIEIQKFLESYGLAALIAKHPTSFIADNVKIGNGSQILANSSICVGTIVGRGCIINTGAIVDHECQINDGTHICPGACLAGCVEVGRFSTIGTGATVLPKIKIGEGVMVGAGTVVIDDIPSYTVVVGNPAKIIN